MDYFLFAILKYLKAKDIIRLSADPTGPSGIVSTKGSKSAELESVVANTGYLCNLMLAEI